MAFRAKRFDAYLNKHPLKNILAYTLHAQPVGIWWLPNYLENISGSEWSRMTTGNCLGSVETRIREFIVCILKLIRIVCTCFCSSICQFSSGILRFLLALPKNTIESFGYQNVSRTCTTHRCWSQPLVKYWLYLFINIYKFAQRNPLITLCVAWFHDAIQLHEALRYRHIAPTQPQVYVDAIICGFKTLRRVLFISNFCYHMEIDPFIIGQDY